MSDDDQTTANVSPPRSMRAAAEGTLADRVRKARDERYEPEGELARGGMGIVEQVVDRSLVRALARKRVRADIEAGDFSHLLVREARVTAWLAHPNVVPVHDLDVEADDDIFFTMRLVGGETLEQWITSQPKGKPVDWDTLLDQIDALVRVCDALGFAHRRGVVHCDIKPSNIMVGEFGEVYLMDWGVARLLEPLPGDEAADNADFDGIVVGTPGYMSPEQAFGMPLDQHADIFSLGAVLFHVLTGRAPYQNDKRSKALGKARAACAPRPSQLAPWVPPALDRVVARAMARLPEDRYPSVFQMKADLNRFIRGGSAFDAASFSAGETIIRQGETAERAYIIESGRVRVDIDGREVRFMGPGEVFGEMAIIDASPRSASVTATEPTTVRTISGSELLDELDAMKPWMGALVRSLTRRLRDS